MPGVIAHNVFHRVGDGRTRVDVLRDVSLEAPAGQLTAVVGPAGAGKTSLLHVLAGLDRPAGGSVVLDDRPGALTPAERQRAALARALVGRPSLLLADEPAGGPEPEDGARLLLLLREVAHEDGVAVVLFTRDIDDAAGVADRIVMLEGGRVVGPAAQLAG